MAYELVAKLAVKDEMSSKFKRVARRVDRINKIARQANKGFEKLEKSAKSTASSISKEFKKAYADAKPDNAFKGAGSAGKGITAVGVAGAGAIGMIVKESATFEKSMSEVKAISGASAEEFDAMKKAARQAGATTSKSAVEAGDALKYMSLAGWDAKMSMAGLMPMLRLSEAGNLDLGRASDLATDSMASLGLEVQEMPKYLDQLAQTSRKSNTNIDALMEAMIVAGGTFKNFNTPLEEANALIGILANRGTKGTEAGTALNSIMVNITSGMGRAGKAMKKLGISAYDSNGKFKGMGNVLKEIAEKTNNMSDEQKNLYLSMIGGKTQLDTLQKLLAGVTGEFDQLQGSVKNSNGVLDTMANEMQDNLIGSWTALKSAIAEAFISLGDGGLKDDLRSLAESVKSLVTKFNEMAESTKAVISKLLLVGTAFTLIGGPILLLISWLPAIAAGFGTLGKMFLFITSPVGLVIAGILALITVGVLLYKNWDKIKEKASEIWAKITETFNSIKDKAVEVGTELWNSFANKFPVIADFIGTHIESIKQVFSGIVDFVTGVFTGDWGKAWQGVKDVFVGICKGLENFLLLPIRLIIEGVNYMISKINGLKIDVPEWVPGIGGETFGFSIPKIPDLKVDGSHYHGLDKVPYDGYVARLHKGEAVLPRNAAENYRQNGLGNANKITNITNAIKPAIVKEIHTEKTFTNTFEKVEKLINSITNNVTEKFEKLSSTVNNNNYAERFEKDYKTETYTNDIKYLHSVSQEKVVVVKETGGNGTDKKSGVKVEITGNNFTVREEADVEKIANQLAIEILRYKESGCAI